MARVLRRGTRRAVCVRSGGSLVDAVDNLLNKGVLLNGELNLSLANVDLVYARVSLLLCAADFMLPGGETQVHTRLHGQREARGDGSPSRSPAPSPALTPAPGRVHHATGSASMFPAPPSVDRDSQAASSEAQRSVIRLVLTLVEFVRQLLERQAIRRMEGGTLTAAETEDVGRALMLLEDVLRELGDRFGLQPGDLNLDLGPLGRLV